MKLTKLKRYIFILLLILLPTQLGRHFWPAWSYVSGVRVDYLSPTLYLTDVLVGILFVSELFKRGALAVGREHLLRNGLIVTFIFSNIFFSLSPAVSVYKWLKVAEMGFLVWFVARQARFEAKWLLIPIFYESVLVTWQFWAQSSIGGFWYWLGERSFNSSTPGIANAYINGSLIMRPYGTFPHPNVLGGFLAVVLPVVLYYFLHNSRKLTARALGKLLIVLLGYVAIFLSMSRAAILVGLAATLVVLWRKFGQKPARLAILVGVVLLTAVLWPRFAALTTETEAIMARQQLNNRAIEQFTRSSIWGQGLGTSSLFSSPPTMNHELRTTNYALAFQPPHNIYLLLLAEIGLVGFFLFVILLIMVFRYLLEVGGWKLEVALASVLVLGLFDHYFLTLQQGQLILSLILGWSLVTMKEARK